MNLDDIITNISDSTTSQNMTEILQNNLYTETINRAYLDMARQIQLAIIWLFMCALALNILYLLYRHKDRLEHNSRLYRFSQKITDKKMIYYYHTLFLTFHIFTFILTGLLILGYKWGLGA